VNLYQFSGNNPAVFTDPFGLKPCPKRLAKLAGRIQRIANRIVQYKSSHRRGIADRDHLDQIKGEQGGLNKDLDAYHRDGCDDDDNDFRRLRNQATSLAKAKLPDPQMRYGPGREYQMDGGLSDMGVMVPGFGLAPGMVMPSFGMRVFAMPTVGVPLFAIP